MFSRFSTWTSTKAGSPYAFGIACAAIVLWLVSGPWLRFSDTWQLTINTGTTIVTFLMVFLIQHAQNHDTKALMLKLDEVILAMPKADNTYLDLEELTDKELTKLHERMKSVGRLPKPTTRKNAGTK